MTRVVLIAAAPTPWDVDHRLAGNTSLPLTDEGRVAVAETVGELVPIVTAVYRCQGNEAVEETARLIARRYKLRPRHDDRLAEMNLGLWQGLTPQDVQFRYPSVAEEWEAHPLAVEPPEGETVAAVIERVRESLDDILARNRGGTVAIALRPIALQVAAGLLKGESPEQIARHLQAPAVIETVELA